MNYIKYNDTIEDVRGLVVRPVHNVTYLVIKPNEFCIGIPFKSADTIHELINRYITVKKAGHAIYTKSKFKKLGNAKIIKMVAEGYKIFGAIWVKGKHDEPILKPVARVNKEGELELL